MKAVLAPVVLTLTAAPVKVTLPAAAPMSAAAPLPLAALPAFEPLAAIVVPEAAAGVSPLAASAQLQTAAAGPESKDGAAADRDFYERIFAGAKAPAAPPAQEPAPVEPPPAPPAPRAPLEALQADVTKLLEHLCRERTAWRSTAGLAKALQARIASVIANKGIARRVPKGWFGSETVIEPLDPDLLAQLPMLADTIGLIGRRGDQMYVNNITDLFYSFNVLSGRAASREDFAKDIAWLYGTYRLGRAR